MSLQSKSMGTLLILLVLALLSATTTTAFAQGDTLTEFTFGYNAPVSAAIGETVYIPITKMSGTGIMSGFDFLLRYDEATLTLQNVFPGYIFDDTSLIAWEQFEYSTFAYDTLNGFVRGVGIADINDGDSHPLSYQIPDGSPLFILQFAITNDTVISCIGFPIQFYWEECGDNAITADSFDYLLGISDAVLDWTESGYVNIADPMAAIPGINGAPDVCITDTSISRLYNFYNPNVYVECGNDTVFSSGDINCNGVPYEIADVIMYFNYFLYGASTFETHIECSTAESDLNADGLVLRLEDAAYLQRIVTGDALPGGGVNSHIPVTFLQNSDAKFVSIDYGDELSAISLVFNGEITPTLLVGGPEIITTYGVQGGETRVLVYPDVSAHTPGFYADTLLLTYTGEGTLYEAGAADNEDNVFDAQITHIGGVSGTPYTFQIGYFPNASYGQEFSIPVTKMGGSEDFSGFDFLFGYEQSLFNVTDVTPGPLFDQPGSHEWEYFNFRYGTTGCGDTICPSYMLRVVGLAELIDGPHHPLSIAVPDTTVMFTIDGNITSDTVYNDLHADMRFLWMDCGDNAIAMGSNGEDLALSRYVYSYDGGNITSPYFPLPSRYGAPEACLSGSPIRFADFINGGFEISGGGGGGGDTTAVRLVVNVGNANMYPGDNEVYLDVYMSNPQDTVVGFEIYFQMDNPELAKFGISPDDTLAFSTAGTLTEDWQLITQTSLSGEYHDLRLAGLSAFTIPFAHAIPPQEDGLLVRLVLHAATDTIVSDTMTTILINNSPELTNFSDQLGFIIGLDGLQYDPNAVFFNPGFVILQEPEILGGDCNADGTVNIGDAVTLLDYIFKGGLAPQPLCTGDTNCDGFCNIGDPVYIINYIFKQGTAPCTGCR